MKNEIYSIIKHNKLLAKHTVRIVVRQLLSKYKLGKNIHEHRKAVRGVSDKNLLFNLSQRLNLNKHVAIQNLSFYYTWKKIRIQ